MDVELKKQWIKALRSGEYQQGQEYLHKNGKFCCLGVLCTIAPTIDTSSRKETVRRDKKTGYSRFVPLDDEGFYFGLKGDRSSYAAGMITNDVATALGLDFGEADALAGMNDDGQSFKKIATYIKGRKQI